MGFVQRLINLSFILGQGSYGESGTDTVNISGLRTSVRIVQAGGATLGTAQIEIYGMTLSLMNQLSTLGVNVWLDGFRLNSVIINAGDAVSGMSQVFKGDIIAAWADFQSMPEVCFRVTAQTGAINAVAPTEVNSFPGNNGTVDVATTMQVLATKAGWKFENNNVNIKLTTPYLWSSLREQIKTLAEQAGICHVVENDILAIWVPGQARNYPPELISPASGMIGYPTYTASGISIRTLFNPALKFGATITVEGSSLTPANKQWIIFDMDYDLESLVPDGKWFTTIMASSTNFVIPP